MLASRKAKSGLALDLLIDGARWLMIAAPVLLSFVTPARAGSDYSVSETIEESIEEVDAQPLILPDAPNTKRFGPFRLVSADRVELIDGIDSAAPAQFRAMLAAHPGIKQIDMIDCPGSEDDDANLALARMIRKAGLSTHVPANGAIRSGGVELFLAGVRRIAEPGAEIGVHSWRDSDGLEAEDFSPDDPVHQPYLSFYRDMGMTPEAARAFYSFTNQAAPFDDIHDMSEAEIKRFGLVTG